MAYGSTICAERSAILRANARGVRTYSTIAIIGRGHDFDAVDVVSPCGSCRQMIYESYQIAGEPITVLMSDTQKEKIVRATIDELLPLGMGPRDLGVDISRYQ
jgi:cytidine deaminase